MKLQKSAGDGCGNKGSSFLTRCLSWKATLAVGIAVFLLFFELLPQLIQRLAVADKASFTANIAMALMDGGFPIVSRQLGVIAGLGIVAVALFKRYRQRVTHP